MSLYLQEHKTTAEDISPGSPYWYRLILDPQLSLYVDGARSLGLPVDGILYDVLYKPQLRPLMATPVESRTYTKPSKKEPIPRLYSNQREFPETPEAYGARVLASIVEDPDKHYQRRIIVRLPQEIIDARMDQWHTANNIKESRRLKMYPRNPDSCKQWSRSCDYFSVCCGIAEIDDPLLFFKQDVPHEELDGAQDRLLTQSSMRCYRACQRRFQYRYEMRIRPNAKKPETLRRGSSVHRALEAWCKTGGDLQAAFAKLDREDPYSFEYEKAMMIGYHAMWEHPGKIKVVEGQFRMPLKSPISGRASKLFDLGGKVDVVVEVD